MSIQITSNRKINNYKKKKKSLLRKKIFLAQRIKKFRFNKKL